MDLKRVGVRFDRVRVDLNENFDKIEGKYKGLQKRFDNAVEEVADKAFDKVVDRAKIDWLPPVDTFDDLATTYPDATEGQTVMTRDTGKIYRMTDGVWMEIQDIDPTAINEVDSRLSSQLAKTTKKVPWVSLEEFKTYPGDDWKQAILDAIDAVSENGSIQFPTYDIKTSRVAHTGKGFKMLRNGGKVIQIENQTIFDFKGSWGTVHAVSSVENVNYTMPNAPFSTLVTKLTLSSTPTLKENDTFKIFSDDFIPDSTTNKKGEFLRVLKVEGNDIYSTSPVRETYISNIRVAKLNKTSFDIQLDFTSDIPDNTENPSHMITIASAVDCRFDCTTDRALGTFLNLRSICGYSAKVEARGLKNDVSKGHWGYGILDTNSGYGTIEVSKFYDGRHGFTTNGMTSTGDNPETYGISEHITVLGSNSFGSYNSGFDTHQNAYNIHFDSCSNVGSFAGGASSSGVGFQIRGKNCRITTGYTDGNRVGCYIFNADTSSSGDTLVENLTSLRNSHRSLLISGRNGYVSGIKVKGGTFEASSDRNVEVVNAEVQFENVTFVVDTLVDFASVFLVNNGKITLKNCTFDLRNTGTSFRLFHVTGLMNLFIDGLRINFNDNASKVSTFFQFNAEANHKVEALKVTSDVFRSLTNYFNGTYDVRLDYSSSESNGRSNGTVYQTLTANNQPINIQTQANDVIYCRLRTTTGNYTVNSLPTGYKVGQTLLIRNQGSGGNTITILKTTGSGHNYIIRNNDLVLAEDEIATFVWGDGNWFYISKQ